MFETTPKRSTPDEEPTRPAATQITRALAELGIERISAHSPQAKGRIERFFEPAQDRLVKELRLAGLNTLESANQYLVDTFLPEWQQRFTVRAANATDAHRPLTELHDLAASLSFVETRTVDNDYTFPWGAQHYQVPKGSVPLGLRARRSGWRREGTAPSLSASTQCICRRFRVSRNGGAGENSNPGDATPRP